MKLFYIFLSCLPAWVIASGPHSFKKEELELSVALNKACQTNIRFNLHDYEYGTDESSLYRNRHFQNCAAIQYVPARACEKHPKNQIALKKIQEIVCQRGSRNEPRIVLRGGGQLVYNIASDPNGLDREKFIEQQFTKLLGFDFQASLKEELAQKAKSDEAAAEKAKLEKRETESANRQKKIDALTSWFQTEVQKITKNPGPDMSKKIEALTKSYEEKMNAIIKNP